VENLWEFSLRELVWRADCLRMETWDLQAWLILHIPHFGSRPLKFADVQPLRADAARLAQARQLKRLLEQQARLPAVFPPVPPTPSTRRSADGWRE